MFVLADREQDSTHLDGVSLLPHAVFQVQSAPDAQQGPELAVVVLHLESVLVHPQQGVATRHRYVRDSDVALAAPADPHHLAHCEVDYLDGAGHVVLLIQHLEHELVLLGGFFLLEEFDYAVRVLGVHVLEALGVGV